MARRSDDGLGNDYASCEHPVGRRPVRHSRGITGAVATEERDVRDWVRRVVVFVRFSMTCALILLAGIFLVLNVRALCISVPLLLTGVAVARRTFSEDRLLETLLTTGMLVAGVGYGAIYCQRQILDVVCWDSQSQPAHRRAVAELVWRAGYSDLVYAMSRLHAVPDDPLGCPEFPEDW